ncbi:MAG: TIGR01906 family membrane protein [Eubacteriales bacterium]|nr:TIGR01906 family membrane protein [Eubacteriales bacterium]
MKNTSSKFMRVIAALLTLPLLVGLLFTAVRIIINDADFFAREYETIGNAAGMGMSNSDLTAATMQMIDYMEGRAESIDLTVTVNGEAVSMFNERERLHMVDVRALYQNFARILAVLTVVILPVLLIMQLLAWIRKKGWILSAGFFGGSGLFLLLLAAVMVWVLIDFNSFWTGFHLLFFTNDLWLLDPVTSRMINMMPWQLFFDIVTRVALLFAGAWAVLGVVFFLLGRLFKKKGAQA